MTEYYKENDNKDKAKNDAELWDRATKDVTPFKNKNSIYQRKEKSKDTKPPPKAEQPPIDTANTPTKNIPTAGTDRRTQQRLKRGKMPIDGKLDLHGKTQNEAYDALMSYIPKAQEAGKRCILVITGKGLPRHGDPSLLEISETIGVLKQKTPQWLGMPPLNQYILDIQPARPNHGGEGALYVLLKRKRK